MNRRGRGAERRESERRVRILSFLPLRVSASLREPRFRRRCAIFLVLFPLSCGLLLFLTALSRSSLRAPQPTLLLLDRHGEFLGEAGVEDSSGAGYWELDEVPQRVAAATLAIEDRRFARHPGVDPVALARAVWQNLRSGERISGASTIAMQVARMQDPGPRTVMRKIVEATTAVLLTWRYGRNGVLRHYLRIVPYGNRIHGIAYAARRYLDKPVEDLSWAETAFLCAIPQSPSRMNPFDPRGRLRAVERGKRILALLFDRGLLQPDEYELARQQLGALHIPPKGERPRQALHAVLRLESRLQDSAGLRRSPVVRTSLDLELQKEISWMVFKTVKTWEWAGAGNAAVIVVDRDTSEVLAWAGSAGYFDDRRAGSIDYTQIRRSAGSTLKPFFYAAALDQGIITPSSILDDLHRGPGGISNADQRFLGPLLPRVALANSRNVPAVELLNRLGVAQGYALLNRLGLHDYEQPSDRYGLGLVLGALPLNLEELVRAYTALSGGGLLSELRWYEGQPVSEPVRVFSEESARQVSLFLSDPQARLPSFPRMGSSEYRFPVAVKTGTSSNYRDAWAVAYSNRYLVGAWIGHPDFRPMNGVSGYRSSARLTREVLEYLHPDQLEGLEDHSFPPPRGYESVRICALSGHRATDACDQVYLEWFPPGQQPHEQCRTHVRVAVDARTGRPAGADVPARFVEVRTQVRLPARYASWLEQTGVAFDAPPDAPADRPNVAAATPGPAALRDRPVRIRITSPPPQLRLAYDPETPAELSTLALEAVVEPSARQVVWYVDGQPFRTADYPFTVRWPLQSGEHVFEVRLPHQDQRSPSVRVWVE